MVLLWRILPFLSKIAPIKTLLKTILSLLTPRNEKFGLFVIMGLALLLVVMRGSSSEGQRGLLGGFLQNYVEETTAAVVSYPSHYQLSEINSLSVHAAQTKAPATLGLLPMASQENMVISRSTIFASIIDVANEHTQVEDYTVQDGDVLSEIAENYGVTLNTILWANNLTNANAIKPGMELKIPPVSGVIHKVKSGDTVQSIAKKYGAEAAKIVSFNDLGDDATLKIGDELIVPDGKIQAAIATEKPKSVSIKRFSHLPILDGFFGQPTTGHNWGKIHGLNGVDIANQCGTPIYAAADGVVEQVKHAGYNGGFGKYIKIRHGNGTATLYAHASQNLVQAIGERVTRGQQISIMGTTGRSTGCHVHFEVHGARNPMAKY